MENQKKRKRGLLSIVRESMTKTGGCCGAGETCCGPATEKSKETTTTTKGTDRTEKK